MKIEGNILIADEGYYLTQANINSEEEEPVKASKVALGKYSSVEDWIEVKDEDNI